MGRRTYSGSAVETALSGAITNTATSLTVVDGSTYGTPSAGAPMVVAVGIGTASEEQILVSSRSGNTFTVAANGRNWQLGGSTTGLAHQSGEIVRHVLDATTVDEVNDHVSTAARDDHTQYLKTDGTRAPTGISNIAGVPGTSTVGDSASKGTGPTLALSDHRHGRESAADLLALLVPAGTIWAYGGATAPTGFALADGTEVDAATYPALATEFGSGATSRFGAAAVGKVKLPDLRQKFPMGKAASGTGATLGGTGGSKDQTVTSHNHTQDPHTHTQNGHGHTQDAHGHVTSESAHRHGFAGDTGNRFLVTSGGAADHAGTPTGGTQTPYSYGAMDTATTGLSVNNATATNQGTTATNQNATATNQLTGVSGTDANLPAYQVVNYIVKVH